MLFRAIILSVTVLAISACNSNIRRVGDVSATTPEEFDPIKSYAVVTIEGTPKSSGIHLFCKLGPNGEFAHTRKRMGRCSGPGVVVGDGDGQFVGVIEKPISLPDGREILMLRMNPPTAIRERPVVSGKHVLTKWNQPYGSKISVFAGRVPVYRFETGAIHYIGHSINGQPVEWREDNNLFEQIKAVVPKAVSSNFISESPEIATIKPCSRTVCESIAVLGK